MGLIQPLNAVEVNNPKEKRGYFGIQYTIWNFQCPAAAREGCFRNPWGSAAVASGPTPWDLGDISEREYPLTPPRIISNASDAIDKLCYVALTDDKVGMNRSDFAITVSLDRENRTLTVSDNGIGMSKEELENNLV